MQLQLTAQGQGQQRGTAVPGSASVERREPRCVRGELGAVRSRCLHPHPRHGAALHVEPRWGLLR